MSPCPSRTREINMDTIRVVLVVSNLNSICPSLSETPSIYDMRFYIRLGIWWTLPSLVDYYWACIIHNPDRCPCLRRGISKVRPKVLMFIEFASTSDFARPVLRLDAIFCSRPRFRRSRCRLHCLGHWIRRRSETRLDCFSVFCWSPYLHISRIFCKLCYTSTCLFY
jgi:hypothetical protein